MIPAIEFEQNRRGTRTSLISSRDHSVSTTTMIKSEPVNMTGKPHQPSIAAFKCEYCLLEFSLKEHLVKHVADIHRQTDVKRELKTSRSMEVHAVSITDTYPRQSAFKCEYCPLEFSLKEHLVNHVADIHGLTDVKRELNTSRPMEVHAVS
eukprot:493759_1